MNHFKVLTETSRFLIQQGPYIIVIANETVQITNNPFKNIKFN